MHKLLVIEDDADAREALRQTLTGAGYNVVTANGADEALNRLETGEFRAAVVDLALPDRSGAELVERLRSDQRFSSLPVLVHTAFPVTSQLRLRLIEADAVVEKDGKLEGLLSMLEKLLEVRSPTLIPA